VSGPVLKTERLLIRDLRMDDLDDLAALFGDPETMRFFPRTYGRDEVRAMIDRNLARYTAYGFGLWALEERNGGAFLGDCGLTVQLVEGIAEVEIAWHVVRHRWRQGIATEAARAVRDHAFGDLSLRRLIALVRPVNDASQGVARKLGMEVERMAMFHDLPHLVFASTPRSG
jgi:ribosomal-protein-alanine N-acetyltransferase